MRFALAAAALSFLGTFAGRAEPAPPPNVDRVYVLGEVRNPGAVDLIDSKMTIFDVIAQCGGFTKQANPSSIRLIRHLPGLKSQIFIVNLSPYVHGLETAGVNPEVKPGDVINVDQAFSTQ